MIGSNPGYLLKSFLLYQDILSAYCARREDATLRQKRPLRLKLSGACTACWARLVRFSILLLLQAAGAGVDLLWAAAQNRHALLFPLGQNFHPKVTSGPRKNIFICLRISEYLVFTSDFTGWLSIQSLENFKRHTWKSFKVCTELYQSPCFCFDF